MRFLPLILALFPSVLWAEEIPLTSKVTDVTLYPQGATIVRQVPFSAPAGTHDLILLDLPRNTDIATVRVAVDGATLGSVTARRDFVPPQDDRTTAAIDAAEAEVERLEAALRGAQADIQRVRLETEAADARVAFLSMIGKGEGVAQMDVTALRALVGMIGDETLAAKQTAHDARLRADAGERDLKDLMKELDKARQALKALVPEKTDRALLSLSVSTQAQTEGTVTVSYLIYDAAWVPNYDVYLERESGKVAIKRGAMIYQNTGENWDDVSLTLSTVRPSEQTAPSGVWAWRRYIEDPVKQLRKDYDSELSSYGSAAAPVMEAPVVMDERAASADFDGISVTYGYPDRVSVASGADQLRIALGQLETTADVFAQAVPLYDETAFVMAKITNDMGELILPGFSALYLDDAYVGQSALEMIAAGAEADLSFGPVDGLRLTRTVLDREEGDRGVLSRSNDLTEKVEIEVENLTGETWPMRLLDRVPYSEQEDLEITWQASPRVTETDVDGKRGVLAWEFDMNAGQTRVITLEQYLEWPDGKVLR